MADNENLPIDWDYTSTTGRARFATLPSSDGPVLDACKLGERLIVFQANALSAMEYIGGNRVFAIRRLFSQGLITPGAAVEFSGGLQLVVTQQAIIIHDGVSVRRPADNKVETKFFAEMTNSSMIYLYVDDSKHEVSICYPVGTASANKRLVFNWEEGTWTFDSFGEQVYAIAKTFSPILQPSWSTTPGRWIDQAVSWFSLRDQRRKLVEYQLRARSWDIRGGVYTRSLETAADYLLLDEGSTDRLLLDEDSPDKLIIENIAVDDYDAYCERLSLDLDELVGNAALVKYLRAAYIYITGTGTVNIQFGVRDTPRGPTRWGAIKSIDMVRTTTSIKVDIHLSGRFLDYRIGSWDGAALPGSWRLSGMDLDVDLLGEK